jgi:hypothetical protein
MGSAAVGGVIMPKKFFVASALLVALMAFASGTGVLVDGLYRDVPLVRTAWIGNDWITLVLAVPTLALASLRARRSPAARLVAAGAFAYALYGYAFYAFGAAFNALFLVYVAILVTSTLGLVGALTAPAVQHVVHRVRIGLRHRRMGLIVVGVSLALGAFWITTSLAYLWTGRPPAMVTATAHPTNVTGALDLWLVVTFGLWGGLWLWRARPWGYVIATVWSVKGVLYMTALSAAAVSAYLHGAVDDLSQLALWVPIGLASLVVAVVLLRAAVAPSSESTSAARWTA